MNEITLFVCPRCQQRAVREKYSGDFIHTCHGSEVLKNEDILVIGNWEDYTGSDFNVHKALLAGLANNLFGTRAWIEGANDEKTTSRGFEANRFRTRQHLHYIPDTHFKVKGPKPDESPDFKI